jgi:thiosulfate/3-mercaptopyruvate sulfurtransferase
MSTPRGALFGLALLVASQVLAGAPAAFVSTGWLQAHLKDGNLVVMQVARNGRADYDAGHIPGACLVPWEKLTATRDGVPAELPRASELKALFESCGAGDGSRIVLYGDLLNLAAARAWFTLDYLGLSGRAALLDGGIEQWRAEKRPLEKTAPAARAARLTVRVRPQAVVSRDQVRDLAWSGSGALLIDARAPENYKAGHIPGAVNAYWMDDVVSKEHPVLRPAGELRKRYQALGAAPGTTIVVYCQSGVQATKTYVVLKSLGYDARLYDGSLADWTRDKEAPLER